MDYRIFNVRTWSLRVYTHRQRVSTTFFSWKSSHKFVLVLLPGFEPRVFGSRVQHSTNWATPYLTVTLLPSSRHFQRRFLGPLLALLLKSRTGSGSGSGTNLTNFFPSEKQISPLKINRPISEMSESEESSPAWYCKCFSFYLFCSSGPKTYLETLVQEKFL